MKDHRDITACVVDRGTFFPVAQRLARDYKRVIYHIPNGEAFETFANACRGDGHPDVYFMADFWPAKKDIDLFVFPDCTDSGLQSELESQGFPVWGSKEADREEKFRGRWLDTCEMLGLSMPKTHTIRGLTNLQLFLRENEGEWFVKLSRFRGDMETWCAKTPAQTQNKLDVLAMKFGPFKEHVTFYVQEKLDTDIEGGADSYSVHGMYPDKIVLGYEKKGESYFATWKSQADMPPEIWKPSEVIAPLLREYRYCNMVSTEVRVKDEQSYLLDPCFRFPSPAGEEELEWYGNIAEIIWHGANGELLQPEMTAKFAGEAIIKYTGDREGWKSLEIEQELRPWVKLYASGYADDTYHFPPSQDPDAIGCVIGLADTPSGVLDFIKDIASALEGQPVEVLIKPMADLIQEIEKAEDQGIAFTEQPMPEPAEVVSET